MSEAFDLLLEKREKRSFHVPGILDDRKDFDGPLDLLLFLVSKNNANIYDLPISLLTQQFLDYMSTHSAEIGDMTDFYRTAAELLYIKTRLLLPQETELDEEYEDPREDLVERLIEYRKYRRYMDLLTGADSSSRLYFSRPDNLFSIPFEDKELFKGVTLQDLSAAFSAILAKTPPSKIFNIYQPVSVKEKSALMLELLDSRDEISIEDLIVDETNPLHVICSFMSILECAKARLIIFRQDELYGKIFISRRAGDWDPGLADEYDREADEYEREDLGDAEDFSILTEEAQMKLDTLARMKAEERINAEREGEEDVEYTGEEEEILFDDED